MNKSLFLLLISSSFVSAIPDDVFNQILAHYRHEILATNSPSEKFRIAFSHIPESERYRLFIDMGRLKKPKPEETLVEPHLIFDVKEPGYFASMDAALKRLPEYLFRPLDLHMALELHDLAVAEIKTMAKGTLSSDMHYSHHKNEAAIDEMFQSGLFCEARRYFQATGRTRLYGKSSDLIYELEGLLELRHFISYAPDGWPLVVKSTGLEGLQEKIKPFIDHYYQSVSNAQNINTVLMAIADLIRVLEVGHYLPDGNTRTNVFLILQKLLIENGLPPALLDDPADFVGWKTLNQMFMALKKGLHNYLMLNEPRAWNVFLRQTFIDASFFVGESTYRPFHVVFARRLFSAPPLKALNLCPINFPLQSAKEISPWQEALYLNDQEALMNFLKQEPDEASIQEVLKDLQSSIKFGNIDLSLVLVDYLKRWNLEYNYWEKTLYEAAQLCEAAEACELVDQKNCLRLVEAILSTQKRWSERSRDYLNEWAQDNFEHDQIRSDLLKGHGLFQDF